MSVAKSSINKPTSIVATIKICQAIWSCKDDNQKDACYKMKENYLRDYGNDNIGVTFIEIELARLEKMIEKMKERSGQMARTEEALKNQTPQNTKGSKTINTNTQKIIADEDGSAKIVPIDAKVNKQQ